MIADERWQRVRALFAQSLEQIDEVRDEWLRQTCDDPDVLAEIQRLLKQRSQPAKIFADDAQALLADLLPDQPSIDALLDTNIGPYRLKRLLGEGGMGRVYLAERVDDQFTHHVALKLIRSEFATNELRQRFLRERNTLAQLAHPNIAQLHDGGVASDGTPYFTLEFIEGESITRWCDERNADVRARVSLMLKICDAVLHAHRSLIVHRDLKPSNILVNADGEPKLLDFGIAKPLAENVSSETLTNADARPMTREYAAPEQLLGDPVTTATDIYALGVLLYLLLSGHMPYRRAESGETTWIKAILEDAPEPMDRAIERTDAATLAQKRGMSAAALKRALRGDLERIVQRALAKKPDSRYPTVDKLADDLRAYLGGRAISGGTRTYRMRKFARRHWLPLAAGALLFLIVLASAIGLAWEAGQVQRQARTTAAVKDFLLGLFQKANPDLTEGKVPTMRDAVDIGMTRLDDIPPSEAELRAELQMTLGVIYSQLGDPKQALHLQEQALSVLRASSSADPILAVRSARFAAVDVGRLGDYAKATEYADEAYDRLHRLRDPNVVDIVRTLDVVNYVAIHRHENARMKQVSEEALKAVNGVSTTDEIRAMALGMSADYARLTHEDAKAVDYYLRLWPLSMTPEMRANFGMSLGNVLQDVGRYRDAATYLEQALAVTTQTYGESDSRALGLGQLLLVNEIYTGDLRKASEHAMKLLDLARKKTPLREDVLAEVQLNVGELAISMDRFDEAAEQIKGTLDYGARHPNGQASVEEEAMSSLGYVYLLTNRLDDAKTELDAAVALSTKLGEPDPTAQARLALLFAMRGNVEAAISLGTTARDNAIKSDGEASPETADVRYLYGRVLELSERPRDAEREYRASLASQTAMTPPDGLHFFSAATRVALAGLIRSDPAKREEARRLYAQAGALFDDTLGKDNPHSRQVQQALAQEAALR